MKFGAGCFLGLSAALALAAAACAGGLKPVDPQAAPAGASSRQDRVPGEYIVTLAEGAEGKVVADLYGRFGIQGMKDLGNGIFLVTFAEDPGPEKMEELRGRNASVKAVQPNFVYRTRKPGRNVGVE